MEPTVTIQGLADYAESDGLTLPESGREKALKMASLLVAHYLTGYTPPTDPAAVNDAIYAQACYWLTNNITPGTVGAHDGTSGIVQSASLLSGSITYAGTDTLMERRIHDATTLCFEARLILGLAGAHPLRPNVVG